MKNHHCLRFYVLFACLSPALMADEAEGTQSPARIFQQECHKHLAKSRALFHSITTYQGAKNVETILLPLNELEIVIEQGANKAQLFYNVHPNPEVRDVAEKCEQDFSKLITQISLSRPLYDAINAVDVSGDDKTTRRYLQHSLRDFKRAGVDKTKAARNKIEKLQEELVKLGQAFSNNIRNDVRSLQLDSAEELAGLPEDYIKDHSPGVDGKITITTDYPDYIPFMKYAERDDLRYDMYKKFRNRAYPDNEPILKEILLKRFELAQLLGYENYAEYISENKMIKNASSVQSFIEKISSIANKRADADYQTLLKRLQRIEPNAKAVGDWQQAYLSELIRQEDYQFDSKQAREYFSYKKVRSGIFKLLNTLFGITIKPWDTETWHSSVEAYEVWDEGKLIAHFYLDMHPREGKFKHAAHFPIQGGLKDKQLPISSLICNFPGGDSGSDLMSHSQVKTFLHEFGHLLHHFFAGQQSWSSFSGVATEWDFVEAPSQMLEEWIWDARTLKLFATNDKGETIPDELVEKMNTTRYFGRGLWVKNQMFYAATSLNYYNRDPQSFELTPLMTEMQEKYSPFDYVDDTHFFASFGHLDGYSAIYYTYMWSLVIANDLFSLFEEHGLHNKKVANQYREKVLAPGGSKDAAELVSDFLGRPYDFRSFEKELNKGVN
ncbi:MAG: thimet oligopeptidase [Planctomycetota bacterium]